MEVMFRNNSSLKTIRNLRVSAPEKDGLLINTFLLDKTTKPFPVFLNNRL
jgi:hypothetical protein